MISWNEIKDRAMAFSREFADETREHAEAKSFWDAFFHVFDISRRRVATFEEPVKKLGDTQGYIDLLWKGTLLIEHKSEGKDLDKAYTQALDYFVGLKQRDLPKYVLVSDFKRLRLYNLDDNTQHEFALADLHENVRWFGFIAGYTQKKYADEAPVNIKAAEKMGTLHDKLLANGYEGHNLEVLLMRLLFCMFAEDTGVFEKNILTDYIRDKTNDDGSDLGAHLSTIFQTLDTAPETRQSTLDESLDAFPYVNGGLFGETLRVPSFDSGMREAMLECCFFDWSDISPAIFGSMFQSVMDTNKRREIGAHYTTEKNILKLIGPLFLDELRAEFDHIKSLRVGKADRLGAFHKKISELSFFDPACGCGNFLVITYRELRRLEIDILKEAYQDPTLGTILSFVNVEQFYGIEIEEFPVRIAETAMWLVDHQMNIELLEEVDFKRDSLPLVQSAHIKHGNALQIDWEDFAPKDEIGYILGNPPFIGKHLRDEEQNADMALVFDGVKNFKSLDYVTCWYLKAAQYIRGTQKKVAFVSTNSIIMGEQVGILWGELFQKHQIKIHFAHRTFSWSSEARGKAAVHVVIIGFAACDTDSKRLFEYEDIKGEPHEIIANNINQYLLDAPNILINNRTIPLDKSIPKMVWGNKPVDGGNLILSEEERLSIVSHEPGVAKFLRPLLSAGNYLNNVPRWCLWLVNANPKEIRSLPLVMSRVEKVKAMRKNSVDEGARKLALTPTQFRDTNNPSSFILIPLHSSEKRTYIPIGLFGKEYIANNSCSIIPDATLYHFGILTSLMHMTWVKTVCGRIKSDYRYSNKIVYNNYPWPKDPSADKIAAVETAAQGVLDAREKFPTSSLADLYDPLTMPPELVKAHNALDRAVDKCYRGPKFSGETERLEFLFALYNEIAAPLTPAQAKPKRRRRKSK